MPLTVQAFNIVTFQKASDQRALQIFCFDQKKYQPGDMVKLFVDRNGETKEIELELGER